jgi:hypothetical protein
MRLALVILSIAVLATPSQAAWIELHNPHYDLPYCLTWVYFGTPSFLVLLHPDGATNILGARLRISGLPPGCDISVIPSPSAAASTGDLFSAGGAEIFFASPQIDHDIVLYEVTVSCPYEVLRAWGYYVTLQPDAVQPAIPSFECPVVITTEQPAPTYVCAEYTQISSHPAWCEIGITPTVWGNVKALYR